MLLAIDVGNTETKLGLFEHESSQLRHKWRVTTELRRTPDEYGVFFTHLFTSGGVAVSDVDAVAIASVVPKLDPVLVAVCDRFFGVVPRFLHPESQQLMPVATERPSEVGADLVAAAIGARERYGAPLIVVSYGTATVFTAIGPGGEYLGASIAPGITISIDALVGRTAKLPQIALDAPAAAIGRNTVQALQSGIVYGFVGQTEAIVARFRAELGTPAKVIATGGLAEVVARHTAAIDRVDAHASLEGLRLYHESTLAV
jgi:type III pantothenate kinase